MSFRLTELDSAMFTPCHYQPELIGTAKSRNIIMPSGSASSKSFVAIMTIREMAALVRVPFDRGGKRSVWLVNDASTLAEQAERLRIHTNLEVGEFSDSAECDASDRGGWNDAFSRHQVLVMLGQTLCTFLDRGLFGIHQINLLILDDCHHCLEKHPYHRIMHHYRACPNDARPRVIGLAPSFVTDKVAIDSLVPSMAKLEAVLNCTVETVNDLSVMLKCGSRCEMCTILCDPFTDDFDFSLAAVQLLSKALRFCRNSYFFDDYARPAVEAFSKILLILKELGPWCAWRTCLIYERHLSKLNKSSVSESHQLFIQLGQTYIRAVKKILEKHVKNIDSVTKLERFVPQRIIRLLNILKRFGGGGSGGGASGGEGAVTIKTDQTSDFAGIIFVQRRYTAYILKLLLKKVQSWDAESFRYLKVDFMVGYSSSNLAMEDSMALHRRQEEVLRNFRQKTLNLLVSTGILEDGIELRRCNVVVRYDVPPDFRSYLQSKGRAQKRDSVLYFLVDKDAHETYLKRMKLFLRLEEILFNYCHSSSNCAYEELNDDAINRLLPSYFPPTPGDSGVSGSERPSVSMSSAIALLNRYCAKLPSDIFTRLVPVCTFHDVQSNSGGVAFRSSLLLPINSPVKNLIEGVAMPSKKCSQMAVALEACKILHQRGELDDHLLPIGKESVAKYFFDEEDNEIANIFRSAMPQPDLPSYVHVIEVRNSSPQPQHHTGSEPHRIFGILSAMKFPPVPSFPLYLRNGETMVSVYSLSCTVTVNTAQLLLISQFHQYVFADILRMERWSVKFRPDLAENTVYVVPLRKGSDGSILMDWPFILSVVKVMDTLPRKPSNEERMKYKFDEQRYRDAVIMPWYRNSEQPHFYYVTDICFDLHPGISFPDAEFASFEDYFKKKYDIKIYNKRQPLLNVDYTSSRLNLLLSRNYSRKAQNTGCVGQPSVNILTQKQILVPELVDIHPIPASLWRMIFCLPSVFYRLNSLLVANEFRELVLREAFNSNIELAPDFEWRPLTYWWHKNMENSTEFPETIEDAEAADCECDEYFDEFNGMRSDAMKKVVVPNFEIGVWDPSLFVPPTTGSDPEAATRPKDGDYDDTWQQWEKNPDSVDDATDELDLEDEIYFDVEFSRKIMNMNRTAPRFAHDSGGKQLLTNGEPYFDDPFRPLKVIEPSGWDTNEVVIPPANNLAALPGLQYLSVEGHLNASTLFQDIVNDELSRISKSTPGAAAAAATAATMATSKTEKVTADGRETEAQQNAVRPKTEFDVDDTDVHGDEEFIDLSTLDSTPLMRNCCSLLGGEGRQRDLCDVNSVAKASEAGGTQKNAEELGAVACTSAIGGELTPAANDRFGCGAAERFSDQSSADDAESLFSFEDDGLLEKNPYGPNPCHILQALTMSNANDGINFERLETVGDSFLKYAVTVFLLKTYTDMHEGKLSLLRSKQVSNYNLYKLGKRKKIGNIMIVCKFDPTENWLPPGFIAPSHEAENNNAEEEDRKMEYQMEMIGKHSDDSHSLDIETISHTPQWIPDDVNNVYHYNMFTQHSLPDKSIADAVEALIGVYLLTSGAKGALKFMDWLGLKTVPQDGELFSSLPSPLLQNVADPERDLAVLWQRFDLGRFESVIQYNFRDKSYLLQAFTHASYVYNRLTDCYQRLEFLGDAVLDYLITRHLFEDQRNHSPGLLTDLRSALVNNTIFSSLAVKYEYHKYFISLCPGLHNVIEKFVKMQKERQDETNFDQELYLLNEEDCDQEEDIEVPKALGDIFESVAGAIYLDSGCSLDTVWRVYFRMMKEQIQKCSASPPKSPIRELLELEPEKVKFAKLERNVLEGKVRVTVDVYGVGRFTGMGRNYRIAKCTAAKRAVKYIKSFRASKTDSSRHIRAF